MNIFDLCTPLLENQFTGGSLRDTLSTYFCAAEALEELYFLPKKITRPFLDERLADSAYLSHVASAIKAYQGSSLEPLILEQLGSFEKDTGHFPGNETLYLIFGLDTTTIYSTTYQGKEVTVLLLESTHGDADRLRLLLAHEFTHLVRKKALAANTFGSNIGERLVSEGIAIAYSRACVPGGAVADYCLVPSTTVDWVKEHLTLMDEITATQLDSPRAMDALFSFNGKPALPDMPRRTGYVYGYLKVQDHLQRHGQEAKDILLMDWTEILKG